MSQLVSEWKSRTHMGQDGFSELNRDKTVGEYGVNREHPHEERRFGDWFCSCFRINRDTWPQCRCCRRKRVFVLKKVPQVYTLDTGCDQERTASNKSWIACPECACEFNYVSCLFRHAVVAHYNEQLRRSHINFYKDQTSVTYLKMLEKGGKKGSCIFCHESLKFRTLKPDVELYGEVLTEEARKREETRRKIECYVQHLGSKHRMCLNHVSDALFPQYWDIIEADNQNPDKGQEIPCLACPDGAKKFICVSNYKTHLIHGHYAGEILGEGVCEDCPFCSAKLESPFGGAPLETILRHVGGDHNKFLKYANPKVLKQFRDLGIELK